MYLIESDSLGCVTQVATEDQRTKDSHEMY